MDPRQTIVFQWLQAGDAGEVDAFDHLLHPDAVVHAPAGLSTTGAEEEKTVWRDAKAAARNLQHEVQEVVVDGDVEMARVVVTGTLTSNFGGVAGTGRRFRIDQAVIVHLREGKVAEAWEVADMGPLPRNCRVTPRPRSAATEHGLTGILRCSRRIGTSSWTGEVPILVHVRSRRLGPWTGSSRCPDPAGRTVR